MPTDFDLKWYGREVLQTIVGVTDDALFEGAVELAELAKDNAPVRRGRLRDSIYAKGINKSTYQRKFHYRREKEVEPGVALVTGSAPHTHLVEFGTRHSRAQPFLRPALDEGAERIGRRIVTVMGKDLK